MVRSVDGEPAGYDEVNQAFGGETITRDGITIRVVAVNTAEVGYFLDVEVEDAE